MRLFEIRPIVILNEGLLNRNTPIIIKMQSELSYTITVHSTTLPFKEMKIDRIEFSGLVWSNHRIKYDIHQPVIQFTVVRVKIEGFTAAGIM